MSVLGIDWKLSYGFQSLSEFYLPKRGHLLAENLSYTIYVDIAIAFLVASIVYRNLHNLCSFLLKSLEYAH